MFTSVRYAIPLTSDISAGRVMWKNARNRQNGSFPEGATFVTSMLNESGQKRIEYLYLVLVVLIFALLSIWLVLAHG